MRYISIPAENLQKLNGLSGKTMYVYLLLRSMLFYKKGMKGRLVPTDDTVKLSYGDAEELGINERTFGRAVKSLIKVGLIEVDEQGGYGGGQRPSKYRIL